MNIDEMIAMIDDPRKPFIEKKISDGVFVRIFNRNAPDHLFKWHKDDNSRVVVVINDSDWKFQFDNGNPFDLSQGAHIAIPKDYFHRVIKGSTALWLKIIETKN